MISTPPQKRKYNPILHGKKSGISVQAKALRDSSLNLCKKGLIALCYCQWHTAKTCFALAANAFCRKSSNKERDIER